MLAWWSTNEYSSCSYIYLCRVARTVFACPKSQVQSKRSRSECLQPTLPKPFANSLAELKQHEEAADPLLLRRRRLLLPHGGPSCWCWWSTGAAGKLVDLTLALHSWITHRNTTYTAHTQKVSIRSGLCMMHGDAAAAAASLEHQIPAPGSPEDR